MAELKTRENDGDVTDFLNGVENEKRRQDSFVVLKMMAEATGEKAKMWGTSIVGFGQYHYQYASGREGDWFVIGFSPRKQSLTLYIMDGFAGYADLMQRLGKCTTGKACLYIKKIEDVDQDVLRELIEQSVTYVGTIDAQ